jgi:undecaprenyl-phosphate galactose phosphotransferase
VRRVIPPIILFIGDMTAVILSYMLAFSLRKFLMSQVLTFLPPTLAFDLFVERFYLLLFWAMVFAYEGLYTKRYPFWQEILRLWRTGLVATVLVTAVMFVTGEPFYLSRIVMILALPISFVLLPMTRAVLRRLMTRMGIWQKSACLLADPGDVPRLKRAVEGDKALGYRVVKVMNAWSPEEGFNGAKALIVQMEKFKGKILNDILERAEREGIQEVLVAPDLANMKLTSVTLENLESQVFLKYDEGLLMPGKRTLKKITDTVSAIVFLLLTLPLYPLIALLIKIDSKGPVIFKNKRIGKDGKEFTCYKFRTMYQDADERLKEHLEKNESARQEWLKYSKITNDPRITRVGKFLRKFSLDELPQFINILKGEMSLVGPRPYMAWEVARMEDPANTILKVKPGLTGLWQVSGRNEIDFKTRLLLDEYYVRNWSLWLDTVIILKTFKAVILAKGAY